MVHLSRKRSCTELQLLEASAKGTTQLRTHIHKSFVWCSPFWSACYIMRSHHLKYLSTARPAAAMTKSMLELLLYVLPCSPHTSCAVPAADRQPAS